MVIVALESINKSLKINVHQVKLTFAGFIKNGFVSATALSVGGVAAGSICCCQHPPDPHTTS